MTLVSVITPTWQRNEVLLGGAVASVQRQVDVSWEHIVVSDGPDPALLAKLPSYRTRYFQLPEHDPVRHWGAPARLHGIAQARGGFIAYLDDDDEWAPEHLSLLVDALRDSPEAGFAYSWAAIYPVSDGPKVLLGLTPLSRGVVQTSMLMHRASVPATWATHPAEDWKLVESWLRDRVAYTSTGVETVVHNPSVPYDPNKFTYIADPPPVF